MSQTNANNTKVDIKFYRPKTKFNPDNIPDELKELPHWIIWSLVTTQNNQDKPQKRMVYVKTTFGKSSIHLASKKVVDPRQSFASALSLYNLHDSIAGLGILLPDKQLNQPSQDKSIICIDLDNVLKNYDSESKTNQQKTLELLALNSFTEISQSSLGTHTFLIASIKNQYNTNPGVEIYQHNRFIAMTGHKYLKSPSTISPPNAQHLVDSIVNQYYPNGNKKQSNHNTYEEPDSVSSGNRNNATTSHAGYLISRYGSGDKAFAKLISFNNNKCIPPLSMEEVTIIFNSIKAKHEHSFDSIIRNICHVAESDTWYELDTMTQMTASSLNIRHAKTKFTRQNSKGEEVPTKISNWLPYQDGFIKAQCLTWIPSRHGTATSIVQENNVTMLNLWSGFAIEPNKGDVTPWLDLLLHLVPEKDYRNALLWWIAFTIQCPEQKCQWHPIITGEYGAGKDALFKPLAHILGDSYSTMGNKDMKSDYDDALYRAKLVHISEPNNIKNDAVDFYKRIAASEASNTMLLNIKGGKKVRQRSLANILAITNNLDAFKFDRSERRALVLRSPKEMSDELNSQYFDHWLDKGYSSHLFQFLLDYDLSFHGFNKNKLPFRTTHFIDMIGLTQSDVEFTILERIEPYDVILPELLVGSIDIKEYDIRRKIKNILAKNGWVRWDNNEVPKRIRKKIDNKIHVKSRDWYVRKSGEFFNCKPPIMYVEADRVEKIFANRHKF